jgi:chromate transporter
VKGVRGALISTLGVISPSLLIITVISSLIANFSSYPIVQHALNGIEVAVCVLMFTSIEKLVKQGVKGVSGWLLFLGAFVLSYFTDISTVILVIIAGAIGYVLYRIKNKEEKA